MVWGAYFLTVQGALTALWLAAAWAGAGVILRWLFWPLGLVSVLTTCYTGYLFAQGLARDLWQGPQSTIDLLAQAVAEGAAALLLVSPLVTASTESGGLRVLAITLVVALVAHVALLLVDIVLSPSRTRH